MDSDTQKDFCRFLIRELREAKHELNAYRVMAYAAGEAGFPVARILDEARNSADVRSRTDASVSNLEELIDNTAQENLDRAIRQFLQNPVIEGKPN